MFIRSYARLTGTKFMCLEGGCGACVVNVSGIRTPAGDSRTIAVNAVRLFEMVFQPEIIKSYDWFSVSVASVRM